MARNTYATEQPVESVLSHDAQKSLNFFGSDLILRKYLSRYLSSDAWDYIQGKLDSLGASGAGRLHELSMQADKNPPELIDRTPYGEDIQEIRFHPSYWEMMNIAARSEMFHVKWEPHLRKQFAGETHMLGFAAGQLFAMAEEGLYCPLCMTDGASRVLDRFGEKDDKERLIPMLSSRSGEGLKTGAMFITEKTGGSDVGANRTYAKHDHDNWYRLFGEKWFCSNANADVMLVLARTGDLDEGTHGLSMFLVERKLSDGSLNPMHVIRLKDKLGVRSMATAEIRLEGTYGKLIGEEGRGFYYMTEMINMSRLYNSVAAVAGARRALIEAFEFLSYRNSFGKNALEHALIRQDLWELGSTYIAVFLLVWRTIRALDKADAGDERERNLCRILIPMSKWWSAEMGIYIGRQSMELMGGLGYIEDVVMPRVYRDLLVLPIWEGSGNVIVLDMLRAARKSNGLIYLLEDTERLIAKIRGHDTDNLQKSLNRLMEDKQNLSDEDQTRRETFAKSFFSELIRIYVIGLLADEWSDENRSWMEPAIDFFFSQWNKKQSSEMIPPDKDGIVNLMGWRIK
ncbi:MAG TPA: acyl-CoA dehydrogenase family protein [Balneolales bacterium]|nr:acyl-CoA dehydrogenase family protein [Balneolales bacterium]